MLTILSLPKVMLHVVLPILFILLVNDTIELLARTELKKEFEKLKRSFNLVKAV